MSINIIYPNVPNPYKIHTDVPIILRTACSAGVNRSAVVREYIKNNVHKESTIYPQYGAEYGDYDNYKIVIHTISNDGFYDMFQNNKNSNVQMVIAEQLGYSIMDKLIIEEEHREDYKNKLIKTFWSTTPNNNIKNIFILINEDQRIIDLVIKRLKEVNEDVDLVILKISDVIYYTQSKTIVSQSVEAYKSFIHLVKYFITFI